MFIYRFLQQNAAKVLHCLYCIWLVHVYMHNQPTKARCKPGKTLRNRCPHRSINGSLCQVVMGVVHTAVTFLGIWRLKSKPQRTVLQKLNQPNALLQWADFLLSSCATMIQLLTLKLILHNTMSVLEQRIDGLRFKFPLKNRFRKGN